MFGRALKAAAVFALLSSLVACGRGGGQSGSILNLRQSAVAPDEFLVVPQKPLETPSDLSQLPTPVPGAPDRVAIDFEANLLTALGGRPGRGGAAPATDAALLNAVRVNGVTPDIRDLLRQEDQAYRDARKGRLSRLEKKRLAATIYDRFLLDPFAEAARLRSQGVKTPAVPEN